MGKLIDQDTDWRKESISLQTDFNDADNTEDYENILFAENLIEKENKIQLLLDIAKRYLHPIEAEILFLFLKSRRNKDISLILRIQEPEVARYKKIIIKKCIIYYKFCYCFNMSLYHKALTQLFNLNEKQSRILELFFEFRSLSYIGDQVGSKSSNMHRSLNSIKEKIEQALPEYPELQVVVDFFNYSRYVNNNNPDKTIVEDLI